MGWHPAKSRFLTIGLDALDAFTPFSGNFPTRETLKEKSWK